MARRLFQLSIQIDDAKLSLALNKFGQTLSDFRRFWKDFFAPQFFSDVQDNFLSEGRYVGGWRSLSPSYAAWKFAHYGPKPILQRTGDLIESFRIGGRRNILKVTHAYALFGSSVAYMPFHQYGTPRMPKRVVLFFGEKRVYSRLLADYLREELTGSGFKVRSA
jgi:phage gpG-like protein